MNNIHLLTLLSLFILLMVRGQDRWVFSAEEEPTDGHETFLLAQANCSLQGCQEKISLTLPWKNFHPPLYSPPYLCIPDLQTKPSCKDKCTDGQFFKDCLSLQLTASANPWIFDIWDPWDNKWVKPYLIYLYLSNFGLPDRKLKIYRKWVREKTPSKVLEELTNSILTYEDELKTQASDPYSQPFSWIGLIKQGIQVLNLTSVYNISHCFLCAFLNKPPITAVPLPYPLNITKNPDPFFLSGVPLFQEDPTSTLPICYTNQPTPLCNKTIPIKTSLTSPNGTHFWCNGTILKTLYTSSPLPCVPVIVAPQLIYFGEEEFSNQLRTSRNKWAAFLPVLLGLTLATSITAIGIDGAGLGHSIWTTNQLKADLEQALDNSATSLASLQRQLTSLAQVALQNRRALDLLTAEKGGTYLFLQEQCCYYINESGLVEENINSLRKLQERIRSGQASFQRHHLVQTSQHGN
ncbi:endogenous retrovirus group FC1 Env polyprotein [Saccopteryx bilineata]|uniref:endogenous retrovirus group FC1 Env polyprotein n=1 Tax=Saccopteryx bilineata TaxID=59482 RepID=UPI0033900C7E